MTAVRRLTLLGSTGSIGCSTLDVVARHPDRFAVHALTAGANVELMLEQVLRFKPRYAVLQQAEAAQRLTTMLRQAGSDCEVLHGNAAQTELAACDEVDTVMAAIVGAAGLLPTLAAAKAGKRVLLANKEVLVMAGAMFMQAVTDCGAELLPIDSEHNAIFQCLPQPRCGESSPGVRKLLLTASGGPFRDAALSSLAAVTPEQACAHPNWSMGRKISVDSATMMNKGLELIEARWLFDISAEDITVVIHRQSIIHSMVEYVDGSVLAQMGNPDMRTPIAHALAAPERIESGVASLDLFQISRFDFIEPEMARYPCLELAYQALRCDGVAPAVLNAANEQAVSAFLAGRIGFTKIAAINAAVLEQYSGNHGWADGAMSWDGLLNADAESRRIADSLINSA